MFLMNSADSSSLGTDIFRSAFIVGYFLLPSLAAEIGIWGLLAILLVIIYIQKEYLTNLAALSIEQGEKSLQELILQAFNNNNTYVYYYDLLFSCIQFVQYLILHMVVLTFVFVLSKIHGFEQDIVSYVNLILFPFYLLISLAKKSHYYIYMTLNIKTGIFGALIITIYFMYFDSNIANNEFFLFSYKLLNGFNIIVYCIFTPYFFQNLKDIVKNNTFHICKEQLSNVFFNFLLYFTILCIPGGEIVQQRNQIFFFEKNYIQKSFIQYLMISYCFIGLIQIPIEFINQRNYFMKDQFLGIQERIDKDRKEQKQQNKQQNNGIQNNNSNINQKNLNNNLNSQQDNQSIKNNLDLQIDVENYQNDRDQQIQQINNFQDSKEIDLNLYLQQNKDNNQNRQKNQQLKQKLLDDRSVSKQRYNKIKQDLKSREFYKIDLTKKEFIFTIFYIILLISLGFLYKYIFIFANIAGIMTNLIMFVIPSYLNLKINNKTEMYYFSLFLLGLSIYALVSEVIYTTNNEYNAYD